MIAGSRFEAFLAKFEEVSLVLLLAGMTLLSFSQVVARYVFSSGWGGALELTTLAFAWMTLIGMSYCMRVGAHLGVDLIVRLFPKTFYRFFSLVAGGACIFWALLLFDSSWLTVIFGAESRGGALVYIQKMHLIGLELEDLPIPRWLAYIILPIGLLLFAFRSYQAVRAIMRGYRDAVIASHEDPTGK